VALGHTIKENIMDFITDRIKEKASHGGLSLIVVGVLVLMGGGLVDYAAYAAIAYGAYQVLSKG
tara:strand:+ start:689 stop:880 length:192 start_codon:yes stop_codon:yes gene_type:complete